MRLRAGILAVAVIVPSLATRSAHADEPVAASEPRMMRETGEVTSVVDAFDDDDPFDLNLTLGIEQRFKSAKIRRETTLAQPGLSTGDFTPATENVASFSESTTVMNVGAEIGIFKDLALVLRLPIVLNDTSSLGDLDGSSKNPERLQDPSGAQLFSVPFKGPSRSGVDYFSAGVDYAIFNQQRDHSKPTWVVGVEGRFGVGTPLHACNANAPAGQPQCPDPANPSQGRSPGISGGMTSIAAHSIFSRRFGYLEPYSGVSFLAEFPHDDTDFGPSPQGSLVNHPPLVGSFSLGSEVIPYQRRDVFQRLVIDGRVTGTYHSEGRDYSELFDALGSSQAASLRTPSPGAYTSGSTPGSSVADPNAQKVYFTGVTDQEAYGSLSVQTSVTYQFGEYVKFNAGGGLTWNQNHLLTSADLCNPDFKGDAGAAGPCRGAAAKPGDAAQVTGIPNPNHRDVLDTPGRRFAIDDTTIVRLWLSGVVMF